MALKGILLRTLGTLPLLGIALVMLSLLRETAGPCWRDSWQQDHFAPAADLIPVGDERTVVLGGAAGARHQVFRTGPEAPLTLIGFWSLGPPPHGHATLLRATDAPAQVTTDLALAALPERWAFLLTCLTVLAACGDGLRRLWRKTRPAPAP